ncbi:MAG: U32 family peptidase, partial [Clostridiales bacterium]|nr:U32 family peptidase [Clostridiales bacterium]
LKEAVYYSHVRDVKIHVALNTLFSPNELDEAEDCAWKAAEIGADALIIQDLGLADRLSLNSSLELHASTQMTIYNVEGIKQLKKFGFKRTVLARELSIDEIKTVCDADIMDIEVFCHGAQCICYSGQCLLSSFNGGRSGNKGTCAQPCRKKYSLTDCNKVCQSGYLLSPADLCSLPYLDKLINTGVASIKIEGRLKSREYVALVTKKYRNALDRIYNGEKPFYTDNDLNELKTIFSRGEFSSGYQLGKLSKADITTLRPGHTGIYAGTLIGKVMKKRGVVPIYAIRSKPIVPISKGDVILFPAQEAGGTVNSAKMKDGILYMVITGPIPRGEGLEFYKVQDKSLLERIKNDLKADDKKILVDGFFTIKEGLFPEFTVRDKSGNEVTVLSDVKLYETYAESSEIISRQLNKTGNTPYVFDQLKISNEDDLFLQAAEVNKLRRQALDELTVRRGAVPKFNLGKKHIESASGNYKISSSSRIALYFYQGLKSDKFLPMANKADRVYIPAEFVEGSLKTRLSSELWCSMPWVNREKYFEKSLECVKKADEYGIKGFCVENQGDLELIGGRPFVCGHSLNICNQDCLAVFRRAGCESGTLSPELSLHEMLELLKYRIWPAEVIIYGNIPLMRMAYCLTPCGKKDEQDFMLRDQNQKEYQVEQLKGVHGSLILNSVNLVKYSKALFAAGLRNFRINVHNEEADKISEVMETIRRL